MQVRVPHRWDLSPKEAIALQQELRQRVVTENQLGTVRTVAGVDISTAGERAHAAVVVLRFPELKPLQAAQSDLPLAYPYIPGLLSFREAPVCLEALTMLDREPDLLMIDGQGIAHPRRLGLASHLGLFLDKPTIGCAKSRLIGRFEEPGGEKGDWSPLTDKNELIGAVVRTRSRVKPIFVSVGHKCRLEDAIRMALACTTRYRIPEPTRLAHQAVSRLKQAT